MSKIIYKLFFIIIPVFFIFFTSIFFMSNIKIGDTSLNQRIKGDFNRFEPGINPGQTLLRFKEIGEIKNVEVLFCGSSHAMRGFDTRIFEKNSISSFNMGSAIQTPLNSYFLLKKYISSLSPELIIVEIYPNVLAVDGYESYIDLLTNIGPKKEIFEMAVSFKQIKPVMSFFEVFFKTISRPIDTYNQKNIDYEKYVKGGYVETYSTRQKEESIEKNRVLNVDSTQMQYVDKIINLANEKNILSLFVIHPLPNDYLKSIDNYYDIVSMLKNEIINQGSSFIDFNEFSDLDDYSDFMDAHHLNHNGVLKFNKSLIDNLRKDSKYISLFD